VNQFSSRIDAADLHHIWVQANSCLNALDKARLFITGGTGFFGSWLLESLLFAEEQLGVNIDVVVLTRSPQDFIKKAPNLARMKQLAFHTGDVTTFDYPAGDFTHVIHAATEASAALNAEQPFLMLDTILKGTERVLDFAVQAKVKKFLFTSSGAIYGVQPPSYSHIEESFHGAPDPLLPNTSYGIGKRTAEHLCSLYASSYGLDIKIARCFAFVGPYLPLSIHFAIGNFIQSALQKKPIIIKGDGTPYRSYLYAADLVYWLWMILCHGQQNRAYNVGSEEAISVADLASLVASQSAEPLPIDMAQKPNPSFLPSRYVPSTKRAREELGLKQHIDLKTSIKKTMDWSYNDEQTKSQ